MTVPTVVPAAMPVPLPAAGVLLVERLAGAANLALANGGGEGKGEGLAHLWRWRDVALAVMED
jgi:hypothetical protein